MIKKFIYDFIMMYQQGFKNMTLGRTLWKIILIKVFLLLLISHWLFYPDFKKKTESEKKEHVINQLTKEAT